MAREKFQTLTEQMFYILLCLRQERCGADVMAWISETTHQRVAVGPGTPSPTHLRTSWTGCIH